MYFFHSLPLNNSDRRDTDQLSGLLVFLFTALRISPALTSQHPASERSGTQELPVDFHRPLSIPVYLESSVSVRFGHTLQACLLISIPDR